jgi:uncharacterized membrane protein
VLVSLGMFVAFARSLREGVTPMVERFARMVEPNLSPAELAHCRSVTVVWCVFFVLNAVVNCTLGFIDHTWWALYTGVFAYIVVGGLLAGEYVVRKARFRRYGPALHDRLLRRIFPPRESPGEPTAELSPDSP